MCAATALACLQATHERSWRNQADRRFDSFLHHAAGQVVGSGVAPRAVNIDGRVYSVAPTDFSATRTTMAHVMHGFDLRSHGQGAWDWQATGSVYTFAHDVVRSQAPNVAAPNTGPGAGRIADQHGTGWSTLALKGIWRPQGGEGEHVAELGAQGDAFRLRALVSDTPEWSGGAPAARFSAFAGKTALTSLWAQDAWRFAPQWRAVLGGRLERWQAQDGEIADPTVTRSFAPRRETDFSPKAALSWQPADAWRVKASLGRAVRMPTVSELFQGALVAGDIVRNDPSLKPEKSWTSELSAEHDLAAGMLRATLFFERTRDALYSQVDVANGGTVATIQNVDRIRTSGVEVAWQSADVLVRGLSLDGSVTHADSRITRNDRFPASVGKDQPRVPNWRASLLAVYAPGERWSASLGYRYSGRQFGQLDNSDTHGASYTGFSAFRVADLRLQYRVAPQWRISAGVDNLGAERYWAFHPYPQRTYSAELRHDL